MFGSLANGITEITHFLPGADCLSTINCFRKMGIDIETDPDHPDHVLVHGKGLHGLCAPDTVLDCGNSGTTTRLISGILDGQDFPCTLTGDSSIQKRPMNRIIEPLTRMGACITSERDNGCVPLQIIGQPLHGITYRSPVASAQVKSCILLAGLYADSDTRVIEPSLSRNHTELMLRHFGASITSEGTEAAIHPGAELHAASVKVPGDISSAAYFLAAACMIPGSEILLRHVGTNPTRDGILRVIQDMGGTVTYRKLSASGGESTADLEVRYTPLHGTVIEGDLIPTLIDELPIIAVLAATAEGQTIIRNAEELKVKESNRIAAMVAELTKAGVDVEETDDGMIVHGGAKPHGASFETYKDHRIAMSLAVLGLAAEGASRIDEPEVVAISYPDFFNTLERLGD